MYFKNVYSLLQTEKKSMYNACAEECSTRKILTLALAAQVPLEQFSSVCLKQESGPFPNYLF